MAATPETIDSLKTRTDNEEFGGLDPVLVDQQQAILRGEQDINMLGAICFADQMKFLFPAMFTVMWELLKSKIHLFRDFSQIALGIPRGFAKTTFIKLWIVYCVLYTKKRFVLVVSYNEEHAQSIIKDVCMMLSHPNVISLFGDYRLNSDLNQAGLKTFSFRGRKVILKAVGAKGGIRGLNHEHQRPDLIIFEDYQSKKESENEEISKMLYEEMIGTVMKANSPFGCLYIYVGNMYPTPGSILKKLKESKDWISLIVGAILEDGTSLWEELQPIAQLLEEYEKDVRADMAHVFLAEKLNDETAGIKSGIDITKLPQCPYDDDELPQGRAVVIDPSLDNPTSDYNGIGLIGLFDEIPVLEKALLGKFNPLDLIKKSLIMAFEANCRLICVENIAYQTSLLFWFSKVCEDNGITGFHFMPLNVGGGSKNAKIIASLRDWIGGNIFVKKEVRPLIINETIKFNPLKKNNGDTCLDLATFAKKVVEQHGPLMLMEYEIEARTNSEAAPKEIEENCPF